MRTDRGPLWPGTTQGGAGGGTVEERLLRLVGQIYEAAVDQDSAATLADALAREFNCDSCLIYFGRELPEAMPTVSGILSGTSNFTHWALAAYADYYHDRNVWYERAWRKGTPAVVLGQELIDTRSLLRTEWSDYLHATQTLHVLGVQYRIAGDSIGLIGIHRAPGQPMFDESDRRKMQLLVPHFERAMQTRERLGLLEQRGALTLELLDTMAVAIVLVSEQCRVRFANRTADRLLREPGALIVTQGVLRARVSAQAREFQRLVAEAARARVTLDADNGGIVYLPNAAGDTQPVLVTPLHPEPVGWNSLSSAVAIIFSDQSDVGRVCEHHLMARYGLTRAEAHLLSALTAGQELSGYAESRRIGITTAKTHLKSLFRKTGCRRQSELVRTVLSEPLSRMFRSATG